MPREKGRFKLPWVPIRRNLMIVIMEPLDLMNITCAQSYKEVDNLNNNTKPVKVIKISK